MVAAQWDTASPFVPELLRSYDTAFVDLAPRVPRLGDPRDLAWRAPLQREIVERFHDAHRVRPVDAALLYVSHYECDAGTLEAIAATGVPTLVLSMDDKHAFEPRPGPIPNGQRPLIGSATVHLTNSLECIRWYSAEGAAAYFFPEAADPEIYRPLDLQKDIDASFVGGWYGGRRDLIEGLRALGIHVETFGPGTDNGIISRDEIVAVFNRSRVNLGFGGVAESARITCLKGRDFEVPMTGNAYLTQYNHELTHMYDVGREIACYLNVNDCIEQIRMLLDNPAEAAALGRASRERALRDHSWTARTDELLRWLGILTR